MTRTRIAVRATDDTSVVELELTVPAEAHLRTSIDRLLQRHGARCTQTYFVSTPLRKIMRAKVEFTDGGPAHALKLTQLLEDLSLHHAEDSSPRAA